MYRRWITLSICTLVLTGCQTLGGIHAPTPSTPTPENGSNATAPAKPTPWETAREHGMIFRATGHEPGWTVEVQKSRTPTLFVVLNDSQRHLQVPNAQPFSDPKAGTAGFRGTAQDGTPVELTIHRGQCKDDMSGKKLAASAELDVGASQYKGCGKFLFQ